MDITVILPIHKYNECVEKAIESYKAASEGENTKLIIVTTTEAAESIKCEDARIITVEDGESTSFQHMINKAVKEVDTEFFSILEMDDVYTKHAFKIAESYYDSGFDASAYLPLTIVYDENVKIEVGYMNEAVLSASFSDEMGYLDINCTEDFPNFNYTGGIFNTKAFIDCGMLKESMKAHFWHEFALRFMHEGKKIFVLPKVGYKHTVNREGSLYMELAKTLTPKEIDFWFDLAKKEYFFKQDRNKIYEE